ncbi:C4-dicarboxylate transporter/malic acid transporter [Stagonosporopsis vannaccii]|nr:C4-dicarboxylate transporter/malic acid transporter [Stagonosporopsis vannaccii]
MDSPNFQDASSLSARLQHLTWAWYTFPMSTGGLALLLSPRTQPHTFPGLLTIGKAIYIFDLLIFLTITLLIIHRFLRAPTLLCASITHPSEGLFMPTAFLSLANVIGGIGVYGVPACGPWLTTTYRVLFWTYFATTFLLALGLYHMLFTNPSLRVEDMTPAWDLPIFPVMLTGTLAAVGAGDQPETYAVPMLVAGTLGQGLGMLVSLLMYACYIHRMIQYGLPSPASRPAMFIAVGPPAFTSLALIGMANAWPRGASYFGIEGEALGHVFQMLATVTAVFIWLLAFWFFGIALLANLAVAREITFHLNWWAYIFPNVGFTIATIKIGDQFKSEGVRWVGSVMSILLVAAYLFVLVMHVSALLKKQILLEGKDEDNYLGEEKPKNY